MCFNLPQSDGRQENKLRRDFLNPKPLTEAHKYLGMSWVWQRRPTCRPISRQSPPSDREEDEATTE